MVYILRASMLVLLAVGYGLTFVESLALEILLNQNTGDNFMMPSGSRESSRMIAVGVRRVLHQYRL